MSTSVLPAPPGAPPSAGSPDANIPWADESSRLVAGETAASQPAPAAPVRPRRAARSDAWIKGQAGRVLGGWARLVLMLVLAALVGVLLVRPAHSTSSVDRSALATELGTALAAQSGISSATGSYLPGTGVMVSGAVSGTVTPASLQQTLGAALDPLAQQLAQLPGSEAVVWQADRRCSVAGACAQRRRGRSQQVDDRAGNDGTSSLGRRERRVVRPFGPVDRRIGCRRDLGAAGRCGGDLIRDVGSSDARTRRRRERIHR